MLILSRRVGQRIWLQLPDGNEVWITVVALENQGDPRWVRLEFDAPREVLIDCAEVRQQPAQGN